MALDSGAGRKRPLQEEGEKEVKKKKGRKQPEGLSNDASLDAEIPSDLLAAADAAAPVEVSGKSVKATKQDTNGRKGKSNSGKGPEAEGASTLKRANGVKESAKEEAMKLAAATTPAIGSQRPSSASLNLKAMGMQVYWNLASVDTSVREQAAATLVTELAKEQQAFENKDAPSSSGKGSLSQCAPGVQYALRRLVRGLGSGNKGARQGFALALLQVLNAVLSVSGDSLLELINKELDLSASIKGQDARDVYLGRIFAYGAIVRSKHLIGDAQSEEQVALAGAVVQATLELGNKKSFLRESTAQVVLELLQKLPASAVEHLLSTDKSALYMWLSQRSEGASPESLLLALRLWQGGKLSGGSLQRISLLPSSGLVQDFFSAAHLEKLLEELKGASHSHPRLHSVWQVVTELLFTNFDASSEQTAKKTKKKKDKEEAKGPAGACSSAELATFWTVVVDGGLLLSKSHERKALTMELLRTLLLSHLRAADIPVVLSVRFMRCILDNLKDADSLLRKEALQLLQGLHSWVSAGDDSSMRRVALLTTLQGHSGGAFDSVTKTGSVKKLKEGLDEAGWQQYLSFLKADFLRPEGSATGEEADGEAGPGTSGSLSDSKRMWVLDQIYAVCRQTQGGAKERLRLVLDTAKFLAAAGLFEIRSLEEGSEELKGLVNKGLPSKTVRDAAASRMLSLLGDAVGIVGKGKQPNRGGGKKSEEKVEGDPLLELAGFVERVGSSPGVKLVRELSEEDGEALEQLRALTKKIEKKLKTAEGVAVEQLSALRALAIQLQFTTILEPGSAGDIAVELEGIYKGAFVKSKKAAAEAGPSYMDVLVDVLLSLLARPSAAVRDAVDQVFKAFSSDLTPTGLADLLRVLRRQPGLRRWKKAADAKKDAESDEDSDADDDVLSEEEEEGDEADEGDEGSEEENADEEVEAEEAGVSRATHEEEGTSDESEEFSDMDDDTMFRVDKALAAVLRETKNEKARTGKSGEKSRTEARLHFQYRVLGLLDVFLKKNAESGLVLEAVLPLVSALQRAVKVGAEGALLADKIQGVLKSRFLEGGPKYPTGEGVDMTVVRELLAKSLKHASSSHNGKVAAAAGGASLFFMKVLNGKTPGMEQAGDADVAAAFRATFQSFFERRSRLSRPFFQEAFTRHPWLARCMVGDLLDQCEGAKTEFLKVEAMQLLTGILKNKRFQAKPGKRKPESAPSRPSICPPTFPDALEPLRAQLDHLLASIPRDKYTKVSRKAEALKFVCASLGALPRMYPDSELQQLVTPGAIIGAAQKAKEADPEAKKLISLLDNVIALAGAGKKKGGKKERGEKDAKQEKRRSRETETVQQGGKKGREAAENGEEKVGSRATGAEVKDQKARKENGSVVTGQRGTKRAHAEEDRKKAAEDRVEQLRLAKAAKVGTLNTGKSKLPQPGLAATSASAQPRKRVNGDVRRRLKAMAAKKGTKAANKKVSS